MSCCRVTAVKDLLQVNAVRIILCSSRKIYMTKLRKLQIIIPPYHFVLMMTQTQSKFCMPDRVNVRNLSRTERNIKRKELASFVLLSL